MTCPVKTAEVILNLQKSLQDYKQRIDENTITESNIVDLNYIYIAGWMKAYYPEITIDWVRRNIGLELYNVLCGYIDKVFCQEHRQNSRRRGRRKEPAKKEVLGRYIALLMHVFRLDKRLLLEAGLGRSFLLASSCNGNQVRARH